MRIFRWSCLAVALAAPVALGALGGCGSDEPASAGTCATSTEGLVRIPLSPDVVGKGFTSASVDGAILLSAIDRGIFRVDLATGVQTSVLLQGYVLSAARDGVALALPIRANGMATVDLV